MHWKATTVLICVYGMIKEFRPATPFLTPFLVSSYKNITTDELYGDVYPFWTYSYLIFMVPTFFLTDLLRYKPVIIVEASMLVATWSLLVWGQGLRLMQLMQVCFGISSAAEVSYYSYMYAMVAEKNYKRVSSYIRSAALVGKLIAFSLAQVLVSTHTGSYLLLNQISLVAVVIVAAVAIALPPVSLSQMQQKVESMMQGEVVAMDQEEAAQLPSDTSSRDFVKTECQVRNNQLLKQSSQDDARITCEPKTASALFLHFQRIRTALLIYKESRAVLTWSVWWALATCGMYQIGNYAQTLWIEMQTNVDDVQNGIVESLNTLSGAVLSFLTQYLSVDWQRWGLATLSLSSLLIALLQLIAARTNQVFVAYGCYIGTSTVYQILITAASANIASLLKSSNYAFVFGVNTFFALLFQSGLTFAVADSHGLNLHIRSQFLVYSAYFALVAVIVALSFGIITIVDKASKTRNGNKNSLSHLEVSA